MRLLIVEKDETLSELIKKALNKYKSDVALNLKDAEYYLDIRNYNLVLLDANFGAEIFKFIDNAKKIYPLLKIIVISDDESVESEIKTLRLGADDYIRKPLNFDLLLARIDVALRSKEVIRIKDLEIIEEEEKIIYKGKETHLKGKSFEVFMHLAKYPNQVISKEQLLDAIWEEPELVTPNVIEVAINQIRQKVDKVFKIDTIKTIRRRGYKFCYPKE